MKTYYLVNVSVTPNCNTPIQPEIFVTESLADISNYIEEHPDALLTVKTVTSLHE